MLDFPCIDSPASFLNISVGSMAHCVGMLLACFCSAARAQMLAGLRINEIDLSGSSNIGSTNQACPELTSTCDQGSTSMGTGGVW